MKKKISKKKREALLQYCNEIDRQTRELVGEYFKHYKEYMSEEDQLRYEQFLAGKEKDKPK